MANIKAINEEFTPVTCDHCDKATEGFETVTQDDETLCEDCADDENGREINTAVRK